MDQGDLRNLVAKMAADRLLPAELVSAVIEVESGGVPWAWNPEPKYRWLWDVKAGAPFRRLAVAEMESKFPPKDFSAPRGVDPDAEFWGQQASWGLMQVMGAVARERGFAGRFLAELCAPESGLYYGCLQLHVLRLRHLKASGWPGVVAAYNAGSPKILWDGSFQNQDYVDKVLAALGGRWPK